MSVVHRFVAESASAARQKVGAVLGRDALLLSCRDIQEGVEIIAAPGSVLPAMGGLAARFLPRRAVPGRWSGYDRPDTNKRRISTLHELA